MKTQTKPLLLAAATVISLSTAAQEQIYLEENFDNGIPATFTLVDNDENPVAASSYRNASISPSWAANYADNSSNQAAFSFSSSVYDYDVENWLITPSIHIASPNATLRWDARSYHYDLRERYKVMISTSTNDIYDFTELCNVEAEDYNWHTRTLSLAQFAGEDVYIAFVATSNDKFILAIDNIVVGEMTDQKFVVDNRTRHFVGATLPTAAVSGAAVNVGRTLNATAIECVTPTATYTQAISGGWTTGDTVSYDFAIPVELGSVARYTLRAIVADDAAPVDLLTDSIYCSHFPKTLLAEEGTGTWCNNCPVGTLQGYQMEALLGDEMLNIGVHARDRLTCNAYNNGLSRWISSIPAYIFNRVGSTVFAGSFSQQNFNDAMALDVPAQIKISVERSESAPSQLTIRSTTDFAEAFANSDGRYKLGFAIIEKVIEGGDSTVQANNCSLVSNGEYYYMPYSMPSKLTFFHNVPREGSTAFTGVEGSLPTTIEAGASYDFTHTMTLDGALSDKDDLFVVAYVLNTLSGRVYNIDRADIPAIVTGIADAHISAANQAHIGFDGGAFSIALAAQQEPYRVDICALDGTVLATAQGVSANGTVSIACPSATGRCCIVRVAQGGKTSVSKLFAR